MKENLLSKLQSIIKSQSVNSLGNIYPEQLLEQLHISKKEFQELVDYLHTERVITYKYKLWCDCGEVCTFYEPKLLRENGINCGICGKFHSIEEISEKAQMLYKLDKQELMEFGTERIDFKAVPIPMKKLSLVKKQEGEKMKEIFIGSSSEAVNFMDEIAAKLEELGEKPLLWNESGKNIFVPGTNTIDALIDITNRVKAAAFIFNADDKTWNRKSALESVDTVRDNVLFEYGLFVGALSKENVCFICKGKPKIATDLKGITYIDGEEGTSQVKLKLRDWLNAVNS